MAVTICLAAVGVTGFICEVPICDSVEFFTDLFPAGPVQVRVRASGRGYFESAATTTSEPYPPTIDLAIAIPDRVMSYILAGAGGPTSTFGVDDDYSIFLNGSPLRVNNDGQALAEPPLSFEARAGDVLRIEGRDVFGGFLCCAFNHSGYTAPLRMASPPRNSSCWR